MRGITTLALACLTGLTSANVIHEWNNFLSAHMIKQKIGSNPSARLLAAVHLAQWRAVREAAKGEEDMAAASAAKTVVLALVPNVTASDVDTLYQKQVKGIEQMGKAEAKGKEVGQAVVTERSADNAKPPAHPVNRTGSNETYKWRTTPPNFLPGLAPYYAKVTPFGLKTPDEVRSAAPPALSDAVYKTSYEEVFAVGNETSSKRSEDQTLAAKVWAFNPELLMMNAVHAATVNMSTTDTAKVYAIATAAAADSRIASWDSKWFHDAWRPVTAIRRGNDMGWATDPHWLQFELCPSTPEWPSAHSATAESVAHVVRNLTGSDAIAFSITAPKLENATRHFPTLTDAVKEITDARVWGGMHFRHSCVEGVALGKRVGEKALERYLEAAKPPARNLRA